MVELLPARFQGPPFFGCYFFVFFFLLFLFLLHLARGCSKKTIFIGFLHTLLKHLVPSCSNKEVKAKTPQKKGAHSFFGNPFFDQFFSKTLILHHPLKTVHQKISQKPYFSRLKKDGQVIDPTMAKLLTLLWPKMAKLLTLQHIYIYICVCACANKGANRKRCKHSNEEYTHPHGRKRSLSDLATIAFLTFLWCEHITGQVDNTYTQTWAFIRRIACAAPLPTVWGSWSLRRAFFSDIFLSSLCFLQLWLLMCSWEQPELSTNNMSVDTEETINILRFDIWRVKALSQKPVTNRTNVFKVTMGRSSDRSSKFTSRWDAAHTGTQCPRNSTS